MVPLAARLEAALDRIEAAAAAAREEAARHHAIEAAAREALATLDTLLADER
ncbi:hypothetical protein [Polymorphobacter multimanifer]|uniref:Septal ring factor EnvC (AmiA/AmiB activator) n=1 Tax=Polymorphobacter multimanifer TaxID=1070431 RepID=A0A841L703_9SPHN|nr:hypothetical protein [Polymorphobacter multimanifer]MBB6226733.1 septal ring factor EnvC (AmiA/AmiB activator) [Polymorphobacter multimanifer]